MLSERNKKIILIVVFVLAVLVIGAALYFVFFAPASTPNENQGQPTLGNENPNGQLPSANSGHPNVITNPQNPAQNLPEISEVANGGVTKINILTQNSVNDVALSSNGNGVNYYDNRDGHFYTITADGTVTKLSNKQFPDVKDATWNASGDKAVIEFPDGSNVVYDFTSETQVTLPSHWEDFKFSPADDTIIAKSMTVDPNSRVLVVTNADGSQSKAVQVLGNNANKVQISPSPNNQVIAFSDTGDVLNGSLDRKMIIPIGKNQENFKGLTVEGLDFQAIWNTRGNTILYSVYGDFSGNKPLLWTVNGSANTLGSNRRSIGLNTWSDKCFFADVSVAYCAVPRNLPANSGMQRTIYANYPDDLYKVNLTTGSSTLMARPAEDTAMTNLFVSKDGASLFYTNNLNNRLEFIKLK